MKLSHGLHLAYCANIHRGETWAETFDSLNRHALSVRERVCPDKAYAIGLRLSAIAAKELIEGKNLLEFQRWLERHQCYVFTINGFPYGRFHGERVKERVYLPDWTSRERLDYTNLLFDILAEILPGGMEGSVSTLPGSFKEFISTPEQQNLIRENIRQCGAHIEKVSRASGKMLHLGLEPEPLGYFENTGETIRFFEQLHEGRASDSSLARHVGVNYDACHFAIEYEEPQEAFAAFQQNNIRISKIHLSSALRVCPDAKTRNELSAFADDIYLHQVAERTRSGNKIFFKDLAPALASASSISDDTAKDIEWRVHFHVPLHTPPNDWCRTTSEHVLGVMDELKKNPALCSHFEMETYTWEVLPGWLKSRDVVSQLTAEYQWTLEQLLTRGFSVL